MVSRFPLLTASRTPLDGDPLASSLALPPTSHNFRCAQNLETNCGDHTFRRALEEAFDLNTYANEGNPRLKGRGASFCMERSGYQEAGLNDQGLIFFLPNMTWGQPPYYVHAMIANTSQPNACEVNMKSSDSSAVNPHGVVSAQVSDDGSDIVVRCLLRRTFMYRSYASFVWKLCMMIVYATCIT